MVEPKTYNPYGLDIFRQKRLNSIDGRPTFELRSKSMKVNDYNALRDKYCGRYLNNRGLKQHLMNVGLINE